MENSAKKQKITKIVAIVFGAIILFFLVLVLYSQREQVAGKGKISVAEFNSRIDYRDEMNCTVGDKKDGAPLMIAATDGWEKVSIENYDLDGEKVNIKIAEGLLYLSAESGDKIYNPDYFDYEHNSSLFENLMLSDGDTRTIRCVAQDNEKYILQNTRKYENLTMKKVPNEAE